MRRIAIIAEASVREHARRKLLAFFVVGSILVTALFLYVLRDDTGRLLAGTGTSAVVLLTGGFYQLFALAAALATSMGAIGAPVAGLCALFAIESQIVGVLSGGTAMTTLWWHWAVWLFNLSVVVALAALVSAVVSAPVIAFIIGFVVYQVVNGVGTLHRLVQLAELKGGVARIIDLVYYITPKFLASPLTPRSGPAARLALHNTPGLAVWAVAYLAGLVVVTLVLTRRREV